MSVWEIREVHDVAEIAREVEAMVLKTERVWWFRGCSCSRWELLPSARRLYSREQERYLSNEFLVRARLRHHSLPDDNDYPGWLAVMQHYGLPTRLLDWSRSPLVAAFFATEARQVDPMCPEPETACIWALEPGALNVAQGFEEYLLPLRANQLRDLVTPSFKGTDTTDKVAAAMPIESDHRMLMQQGVFTIHSSDEPLQRTAGCDQWLKQLLIPRTSVAKLARQLKLLGFHRADLFPDLDNLARELKERHRPFLVV